MCAEQASLKMTVGRSDLKNPERIFVQILASGGRWSLEMPNHIIRAARPSNVMVLEDDLLNAMLIEDTLKLAGHEVVGSARTVPHALGLLEKGGIDAAILDLQIDNEMSFDVGSRPDELRIPWALTTAHPRSFFSSRLSHVTLLQKPFGVTALIQLIDELVDGIK